mgnify:FL=1
MIMNIMLATLLTANFIDYQEIRVAIVLYAIAQVLRQSAILIKALTKFARVVKRGKTSYNSFPVTGEVYVTR